MELTRDWIGGVGGLHLGRRTLTRLLIMEDLKMRKGWSMGRRISMPVNVVSTLLRPLVGINVLMQMNLQLDFMTQALK